MSSEQKKTKQLLLATIEQLLPLIRKTVEKIFFKLLTTGTSALRLVCFLKLLR